MEVVLNWLAQGVLVALAAAAGLRLIPRARPRARYAVAWAAYLSLLALPLVPLLAPALAPADAGVEGTATAAPIMVPAAWWTSPAAALALWTAWFGAHAVALARDAAAARAAKRRGETCPRDLLARLHHWSRVSTTGRRTGVLLSRSVGSAGVLGCGRPVIAIAPRLVERLAPADLDRVLVHEWAHVQRRDDLAQAGQRIVHAIIGWHPAAWWLERQLALEREAACDEIAVLVTGSPKQYAKCLVAIAELQQSPDRRVPVLGAVSRSSLHRRVRRVIAAPPAAAHPWRALAIGGAVALLACASAAGTLRVAIQAAESAAGTTPAPAGGRAAGISAPATEASRVRNAPVSRQPSANGVRLASPASRATRATVTPLAAGPTATSNEASTTAPGLLFPSIAALPGTTLPVPLAGTPAPLRSAAAATAPAAPTHPSGDPSSVWTPAVGAGLAIGRASQAAGVATAGIFRNVGERIAASF